MVADVNRVRKAESDISTELTFTASAGATRVMNVTIETALDFTANARLFWEPEIPSTGTWVDQSSTTQIWTDQTPTNGVWTDQ